MRYKIAVIGLGYVGLPLAALLAQRFNVVGLDSDRKRINALNSKIETIKEPELDDLLSKALNSKTLKFTSDPKQISSCNVKIITVGTPFNEKSCAIDYSFLQSALNSLKKNLNPKDIIILKSTVPVGTTSTMVRAIMPDQKTGFAFSPERMIEGRAVSDFRSLPKIIGASDDRTFSIAKNVLETLGGKVIRVKNPETAEMIKMTDNYSRYAFIALTNELALICEKVGVDSSEMISAAKLDYPRNSGLMKPGCVGGSCLNKDPFILKASLKDKGVNLRMVDSAKKINTGMPDHIAKMIINLGRHPRIVTLAGMAFKGETDDTRFSPTPFIKDFLLKKGIKVNITDPLVSGKGISKDLYQSVKQSDSLVILTDHKSYRELNLRKIKYLMNSPLILDMREMIDRSTAESLGFEYHGLGRI